MDKQRTCIAGDEALDVLQQSCGLYEYYLYYSQSFNVFLALKPQLVNLSHLTINGQIYSDMVKVFFSPLTPPPTPSPEPFVKLNSFELKRI